MAKIKYGEKELKVGDNEQIKEACEELEVFFGWGTGSCGACMIKVIKGQENLSGLTKNEEKFGLKKNDRLACQCKIKDGTVEIDF